MPAGIYNFTIEQGTTVISDFFWKIGDNPVDVTGYAARMCVRQTTTAPNPPLAAWNTANGRMTVGGADGKFTIFLTDTDTANITWITGVYDIELVSPSATPVVTRILKGTITVDPEVTR